MDICQIEIENVKWKVQQNFGRKYKNIGQDTLKVFYILHNGFNLILSLLIICMCI